jgi:glutathione peroxidase
LNKNIYAFEVKDIDGKSVSLSKYQGKVLLVVNVASECGFTPQYLGLQKLYEKYREQGLRILAFPCNDFGAQEPGNNEVIKGFCLKNFQLTFDLFSKVSVLGPEKIPLFKYLYDCNLTPKSEGGVRSQIFGLAKWVLYRIKGRQVPEKNEAKWNFHKFLLGKDGIAIASFLSEVEPDAKILTTAIEEALQT